MPDENKTRLPGRQFAEPLTNEEITEVAGGLYNNDVGFHPGPGTCTLNGDDD